MSGSVEILAEASRLRRRVPCSFADEDPRRGRSHTVFKIVFRDSVTWAARTCHDAATASWASELRAAKYLQHIKRHRPDIKAPDVLCSENGAAVTFSEWINGEPLAVWNSLTPLIKRHRLLDGLADFLLQLWTVPAPPATTTTTTTPSPSPSPASYSSWLADSLDRGLRRTLAGTARWGDAVDYLIMRSMIPRYAEQLDAYPGLGFAHGDLNAHNILTSPDLHLTGVVDWDWMHLAPLPAVVHHPWFMADIPGWNNADVVHGDNFAADRLYLENAIKRREVSQKQPSFISALLTGSGERLFFQSAFHFRDIHKNFVMLHCPRTEDNVTAAQLQLDAALCLYPELEGMEGTRHARKILEMRASQ